MKNKKKKDSLPKTLPETGLSAQIHNQDYKRNSDKDYPCKDNEHCFCGGKLWKIKIDSEHYFRCSECGNDYSIDFNFVDTRKQRHETDIN